MQTVYHLGTGRTFREAVAPTQPSVQGILGFFPGVSRLGLGVGHEHPSKAEVKERVELYFYSPTGTSRPVLG
jgi:hypothetical protein